MATTPILDPCQRCHDYTFLSFDTKYIIHYHRSRIADKRLYAIRYTTAQPAQSSLALHQTTRGLHLRHCETLIWFINTGFFIDMCC
jgi:hypothetical protein